jgi:hypothetical protein
MGQHRDHDGGNAAALDLSGYQSDGPVAEPSSRSEKYQVDLVGCEDVGDLGCGVADQR